MLTKRLPLIFLLASLAFFSFSQCVWAGIGIAPARIETSFSNGKVTGQFIITNNGDTEERYRIKATHFTFNSGGTFTTIPPDENSIAPMIKFNPKEFTLAPKSTRQIRFIIISRDRNTIPKDYWGAMELESLKTNIVKGEDKDGRKMLVKVIPSILVPIFVSTGDIENSATLSDLKVSTKESKLTLEALVSNKGAGHLVVKGRFQLIDSLNVVVKEGTMGANYLLPTSERRFQNTIDNDLPTGNYTLKVEYEAEQLKSPISKSIQCTI